MKLHLLTSTLALVAGSYFYAQNQAFYATMDAENAKDLSKKFPTEIKIIQVEKNQAAVQLTENAGHYLHKNILGHGPGFVYKANQNEALQTISTTAKSNTVINFDITQDPVVQSAINLVNAENIKNHIQVLENYTTRKHNTPQALTAVQDLKTKWEQMIAAAGRTADVKVRQVDHVGTPMPSLVVTFMGNSTPSEYIIIGGHLDSISNNALAPGADDDASGIATITEMLRVLLEINYHPKRTLEIMAYAAEEIGLVGSSEIAENYKANNKNVLSYVQFDMTNYKGSENDIYISTDSYNNNDLNIFLVELMTHYNASGAHKITYGNTKCNYGCSDHFSWAQNGYPAAFPFEATMSQSSPYIHSKNDTLANMGNSAEHSAKFAKLGLEFLIETTKSETLQTQDFTKNEISIYIDHKTLKYNTGKDIYQDISIIDASGKVVTKKINLKSTGEINLNNLQNGFYLGVFKSNSGKMKTQKFILK